MALADSLSSTTLAAESRLNPFFNKHLPTFRDHTALMYTIGELRKFINAGEIRESHIVRLNNELRERLHDEEIEIGTALETGSLTSGKKYSLAVFNFKKEDKKIKALFLNDYTNSTSLTTEDREELKAFGIRNDADINHLDYPGLEGVWLVNPASENENSAAADSIPKIPHFHFFWPGYAEGDPLDKQLLSDKGSGLMRLALEEMPAPPGFVIDSEITASEIESITEDNTLLQAAVRTTERKMNDLSGIYRRFGDNKNPLLLSVRGGYSYVEPGRLPTMLNIGLNDEVVRSLEPLFEDNAKLYEMYYCFVVQFAEMVLEQNILQYCDKIFDEAFVKKCREEGVPMPDSPGIYSDKQPEIYKKMVLRLKEYLKTERSVEFPEDPWRQLTLTIKALRKDRIASAKKEMALTIQPMVFGNQNSNSCTGIITSRHPITGEDSVYVEMVPEAQGPAVVTPGPSQKIYGTEAFKQKFPEQYEAIRNYAKALEDIYKDIRNIEFTIEDGRLYILQQRQEFAHPVAMVRCVIDMLDKGFLTYKEAAERISTPAATVSAIRVAPVEETQRLLGVSEKINLFISYIKAPVVDPNYTGSPAIRGFPLCPGIVTGKLTVRNNPIGLSFPKKSILAMGSSYRHIRIDFDSPVGFISTGDSLVGHLAETMRWYAETKKLKPAISFLENAHFASDDSGILYKDECGNKRKIKNGDTITIDGKTGSIYLGAVPIVTPIISKDPIRQNYLEKAGLLLRSVIDPTFDPDSLEVAEPDPRREGPDLAPAREPMRRVRPRNGPREKKRTLRDHRKNGKVSDAAGWPHSTAVKNSGESRSYSESSKSNDTHATDGPMAAQAGVEKMIFLPLEALQAGENSGVVGGTAKANQETINDWDEAASVEYGIARPENSEEITYLGRDEENLPSSLTKFLEKKNITQGYFVAENGQLENPVLAWFVTSKRGLWGLELPGKWNIEWLRATIVEGKPHIHCQIVNPGTKERYGAHLHAGIMRGLKGKIVPLDGNVKVRRVNDSEMGLGHMRFRYTEDKAPLRSRPGDRLIFTVKPGEDMLEGLKRLLLQLGVTRAKINVVSGNILSMRSEDGKIIGPEFQEPGIELTSIDMSNEFSVKQSEPISIETGGIDNQSNLHIVKAVSIVAKELIEGVVEIIEVDEEKISTNITQATSAKISAIPAAGAAARTEEANRIHIENLNYTPTIPDKTIICHIVADSILPAGQRNMLKTLEQDMRNEKYSEKVVSLSVGDPNNPEEFMRELKRIKAQEEARYPGYKIQFDVACPDKDLVGKIQGLGMYALAFTMEGDGDIVQVEGIILALRALQTGNVYNLLDVYTLLTGRELIAGTTDIIELARTMLFILPIRKVDINAVGALNELMEKNIKASA